MVYFRPPHLLLLNGAGKYHPRIRELDFPDTGNRIPKTDSMSVEQRDHGSMPFSLIQCLILNGADFAGHSSRTKSLFRIKQHWQEWAIDRERVEVARIDLLLLLEDAGIKSNRSKREGLKPARRMLWPIGQQGMSDCRGAS